MTRQYSASGKHRSSDSCADRCAEDVFQEAMMSHNRVRAFNKHIFNRLIHTFAGASYSPFALIRHVGRRSGAPYETPIIVEPIGDGVVIALTYGPGVDWYRNVLAAGRATLRWHGRTYALDKPEPIDRKTALPAFPAPLRLILRMLGTQHFVRMKPSLDNSSLCSYT